MWLLVLFGVFWDPDMAKGKKKVLKTDKSEDTVQHKVSSNTKENKPAANKGSQNKPQSVLQSLQSPAKSKSPLSDNSSMLIQEGEEADATNSDSKLKKDVPSEIKCASREAKEQKASSSPETAKKTSGQQETTVDRPKDKVPAAKNRSRTRPKKMTENKAPQNKKVTDYYPIRRSNRKTKTELKSEEHKHLDDLIKNGDEDGMKVKHTEGKGRGVFAVNGFKKGDFVVEYHGDLLDLSEAKLREAQYSQDPSTGCYMYYFQYRTRTYCVDATKESGRLGRLINHSKTGNCQTRLHPIDGTPHLILVASQDIKADEELLYDYGDRSKASVLAHPWLKH